MRVEADGYSQINLPNRRAQYDTELALGTGARGCGRLSRPPGGRAGQATNGCASGHFSRSQSVWCCSVYEGRQYG